MAYLGLALGVLGLAVGLIAFAPSERLDPYREYLLQAGIFSVGLVVLILLWPLILYIGKRLIERRAPLPFLALLPLARRMGMNVGSGERLIEFLDLVSKWAQFGQVTLYGELISSPRSRKLVPVPGEHLRKNAIQVATALLSGGDNRHVCTYDPTRVFADDGKGEGFYYNLHVSMDVVKPMTALARSGRFRREKGHPDSKVAN